MSRQARHRRERVQRSIDVTPDVNKRVELNLLDIVQRPLFREAVLRDGPTRNDGRVWTNRVLNPVRRGGAALHSVSALLRGPQVLQPKPWYPEKTLFTYSKTEVDKICRDRAKRRRSLFRFGKAGRGRKGPRFRRMRSDSNVRC